MWLSVDTLVNKCSAKTSNDQLLIDLTLYVEYARISNNTVESVERTNVTVLYNAANETEAGSNYRQQMFPLHYYPINTNDIGTRSYPYLRPISFSFANDSQTVQLIVQSLSNQHGVFIKGTVSDDEGGGIVEGRPAAAKTIYPIKTGTVFEAATANVTQTWILNVEAVLAATTHQSRMFELMLQLHACPQTYISISTNNEELCTGPLKVYSFAIPITIKEDGEKAAYGRVAMKLRGSSVELNSSNPISINRFSKQPGRYDYNNYYNYCCCIINTFHPNLN